MNAQTTQARATTTEVIDLDSYIEDATTAFQQAVAANRDTAGLRPEHRGALLNELARALKLNPLTKPVIFLKTGQGESIYVTRQGADQIAARLRLNRETVVGPEVRDILGVKVFFCQVRVTAPDGRSEMATATLPAVDVLMGLMKVETKAKRRATLSIAGLGMLSEEDAEEMGIDAAIDRTPPANEPTAAQNKLALDLDDCTYNRDAVALWIKHRADLTADGDEARTAAWGVLVKHVMRLMEVKKTAAEKFLRGAIAEHDEAARQQRDAAPPAADASADPAATEVCAPTESPAVEPPTLADFRAQLDRCPGIDAIANLWRAARNELSGADRAPAWSACLDCLAVRMGVVSQQGMGAMLKKRIAELDGPKPTPPQPPTGTDAPRSNTPADVAGGSVAPTESAGAMAREQRTVLDTDTAHLDLAGTWRASEAGWRDHLAEMTVRRRVEASVSCNGAALGPRFVTLAAERIVAIDAERPHPVGVARLTVIGVTQTLERLSLDASRARAAQGQRAA